MSQSILLSYGSSYDVDAATYFAANISLSTAEKGYVNTFIKALKTNGTWTKKDAIYLPVWESAADNKWNLKNPVDTNAGFRLTFTGTWTHSSSGIIPGGTTSDYASTHYIPLTNGNLTTTSANIACYLQTIGGPITGSRVYLMSASGGSIEGMFGLGMFSSGSKNVGSIGGGSGEYAPTGTSAEALGLMQVTTNGNRNAQHWKNGVKNGATVAMTKDMTSPAPNAPIEIGLSNSQGTRQYPTDRTISYIQIGSAHSDTEVANDYTAIQAFHTSMGIAQ